MRTIVAVFRVQDNTAIQIHSSTSVLEETVAPNGWVTLKFGVSQSLSILEREVLLVKFNDGSILMSKVVSMTNNTIVVRGMY